MAMLRRRRVAIACVAAGLLCSLALLAGCGGESSAEGQVPGKAELMECVIDAGGRKWNQVPILPKGFPTNTTEVFTIGPNLAHLSYYISKRPVFSEKTVKGFAEIQEYDAFVRFNGRVLILLDPDITKKDRELAFACLEG